MSRKKAKRQDKQANCRETARQTDNHTGLHYNTIR